MTGKPRILAFAGSARDASLNKKLLKNAVTGAEKAGAKVTFADLRDYPMPLYDGDLEAASGIPPHALAFRDLLKSNDGFLIASPEYNSSFSPLLKNTIDWASRPVEGDPPYTGFEGKVAAILAASPGALGGVRGLMQLRALLANMRVLVLPDQKALSNASNAFDTTGVLTDSSTRASVEAVAATLVQTIQKLKG